MGIRQAVKIVRQSDCYGIDKQIKAWAVVRKHNKQAFLEIRLRAKQRAIEYGRNIKFVGPIRHEIL